MRLRTLRFTEVAEDDIARLYQFLAEKNVGLAERALLTIRKALSTVKTFPFLGRKVGDDPYLRELLTPFGSAGYVALVRVAAEHVTVLAIRHQREDDYH